jgi:hypothetical protein
MITNESSGCPSFDDRFVFSTTQLLPMSMKSVELEAVSIGETGVSAEMAMNDKPLGKFNKGLFSLVAGY